MLFHVFDGSIKFVSTFEYRHYLSKVEEGKFRPLVTNELRKEDGHKDRFSPIFERTNSFPEIKTDFRIALDLRTLKLLLLPKTKTNFEGEALYRAAICDPLRFQNTENIRF